MSKEGFSRRDFLKLAFIGAAGTASTAYFVKSVDKHLGQAHTDQELIIMQKTATALAVEGKNTTFIPDKIFTTEYYSKVLASSFIIKVNIQINSSTMIATHRGTAWCCGKEGNSLYIATNKHTLINDKIPKTDQKLLEVELVRPYVDRHTNILPAKIAVHDNMDVSVFRVDDKDLAKKVEALNSIDNYSPKPGDQMLIVGFPGVISDNLDELKSTTFGERATYQGNTLFYNCMKYENKGLPGLSGSSITIPDENNLPLAVGILYSNWLGSKVCAQNLEIKSLIEQLT